jgi:hypothetical protein
MNLTSLWCQDCGTCGCMSTGHYCDQSCHDGPCRVRVLTPGEVAA